MVSNKTQNVIGYVLTFLMLVTLINSGYFFLGVLKLSVGRWLAFNACSLAIIIFLICFTVFKITKKDYLLAIPLFPLYFYGTMGLFLMPWDQANLFVQITHVIITITLLWLLFVLLKERKLEAIGKGLLIGMIVFVPIFAYIQTFTQLHMAEFLKVLQRI